MVAAAYGQTPAQVRTWPIQDYLDALRFIPITTIVRLPADG